MDNNSNPHPTSPTHPKPWHVGYRSRGMGRYSFAVLDCNEKLIAEVSDLATAELIVAAVNNYTPPS